MKVEANEKKIKSKFYSNEILVKRSESRLKLTTGIYYWCNIEFTFFNHRSCIMYRYFISHFTLCTSTTKHTLSIRGS